MYRVEMPSLAEIPSATRTIAHVLERAAAERGGDVLFRWAGQPVTVGDLHRESHRECAGLVAKGIGPGDRVALLMENSPRCLATWFALAQLGAVEVPINTAYSGSLLADQLRRAHVRLVVADDGFAEVLEAVRAQVPTLEELLVGKPARASRFGAPPTDASAPAGEHALPDPEAIACVIYTSGTTGPSKGVMVSHHQELSFGAYWADIVGLVRGDVVLNYLPHFHIAGKFLSVACLLTGAEMVLTARLSIERLWQEARRDGVTHFVAVGGVCNMLHGRAPLPDDADNPVRVVYAVPAPAGIYHDFERRFGVKLVECYGSTEAGLVLSTGLRESTPGSCGRCHPDWEVRIADERGVEAPDGQPGEILVRPKVPLTTMSGYDGLPDKTIEAWRDLWFHTGDRGRRDAEGRYWFIDRLKDSIRRRGENISSFEVERLVGAHPAVAEVAAVGVESSLGEQEVKVVVVAREGHVVDCEALYRFCAATMPYFMVPRYVEAVTDLARTPTNKVEKYRLRAAGVTAGTWDAEGAGLRMTRHGLTETRLAAPY